MALNTFQTSVSSDPSPGIEGGFAGGNPYFSVVTPDEGMFTASSVSPPLMGKFAFANLTTGVVSASGAGVPNFRVGFVHRDQPAITNGAGLFSSSSLAVVGGQPVGLAEDGTFWARFAGGASPFTNGVAQKVYASYVDGSVTAAATATPATTTGSITTTTASATISYTGTAPAPGMPVSATGVPANTMIGTVNTAAGTATLVLTTTGAASPATASATVTATYTTNFETAFAVRSVAAAGELAKISVRG
jgi:hypothetical protein